jgi:hypothetical protein
MEAQGFVVSELDPCLFIHKEKNMLAVSWVDDVIIVALDVQHVTNLMVSLKEAGYSLDYDTSDGGSGEISAFLGIQVNKRQDNSFELTQSGLIHKVIRYTGLEDSNKNFIPASSTPLGTDSEGERWDDTAGGWEYAAAVGMLMYLANNTCEPVRPV